MASVNTQTHWYSLFGCYVTTVLFLLFGPRSSLSLEVRQLGTESWLNHMVDFCYTTPAFYCDLLTSFINAYRCHFACEYTSKSAKRNKVIFSGCNVFNGGVFQQGVPSALRKELEKIDCLLAGCPSIDPHFVCVCDILWYNWHRECLYSPLGACACVYVPGKSIFTQTHL